MTYHEGVHGMESLGRIMRAAREARGWSQAKAGARIGVHPIVLGSYERADRNPPVDRVVDVLSAYGLTLVVADAVAVDAARRARIEALRAELAQLEAS